METSSTHTTSSTIQWQNFLKEKYHAQFDSKSQITTFGQPELERFLVKHGPILTSLAHQSLIQVSGQEALAFLQGQLSTNIEHVNEARAQLSSYCDPKGQVLATLLVFQYKNDYYLSCHSSLKESLLKRLNMFILRSKVTLKDFSNQLIHIGFAGEFADLELQRSLNTKIKNDYEAQWIQQDDLNESYAIKVPGPYHRYSIFAPVKQAQKIWKILKNNAEPINTQDWNLLNITAGIPEITHQTSAQFLAQFLNLDKLNAIDFKKGCFPGQEMIARVHYRGKVTKRMFRIRCEENQTLTPGETLELTDSNQKCHKLTIILANPAIHEGTLCLAVGTLKNLSAMSDKLTTCSGKAAFIEPLPYPIIENNS